ncbi:probable indole-3-pyruvate monooxygenase YUCCA11 [Panicum virgatum]|uniref:probable indole-3-pyruvate monooxygenase YUCCA11 n=1 Tax=Panicum virgatum TaxID=38727 RepID=UPI0019D690BA|nr:probable indole-3-pyruvate monooxygenase YUCCA11 [Panicum virgatum]
MAAFSVRFGPLAGNVQPRNHAAATAGSVHKPGMAVNRLTCALVSMMFISLIDVVTMPGCFFLYTGVAAAACAFVYARMPETRGWNLKDMDELFANFISLVLNGGANLVLIVGAGPAGLATAACLTKLSIPHVIVEHEDCSASLWRNRAYDRLKLHLAKEFCELPHMFKSGATYSRKNALVVGCGNSGMEIAYDLASHGANTSIVVRSPVHVMTKEIIRLGMTLVQHIPVNVVDDLLVRLANLVFGDLSRHGIVRPKIGPLQLKAETGRSAVIDVGTVGLIKKGIIKVLGNISKIKGNVVEFESGKESAFDVIVFATGYKSTANTWLKNGESMLNNAGLPKKEFPNHWKGANGLYCAGLARRGLAGIAIDAKNIANDISSSYHA